MAKNLKLNVKNTQLAAALKKLQKPGSVPAKDEAKLDKKPPKPKAEKIIEATPESALPEARQEARQEPKPEQPHPVTSVERESPQIRETPEEKSSAHVQPSLEARPPMRPISSSERPAPVNRGPQNSRGFIPNPASGNRPPYQNRGGYDRNGFRPAFTPRPASSNSEHPSNNYRPPVRPSTHPGGPSNYQRPQPRSFDGPRPPYRPGPGFAPRPPGGAPYNNGPRPPFRPNPSGPGGAGRPPFRPYPSRPPGTRPLGRPPGGGFAPRPGVPAFSKDTTERRSPRGDSPKKPVGFKDFKDAKAQKKPEAYRSFDSRDKQGLRDENDAAMWRRKRRGSKGSMLETEEIIRPKVLSIRLPITIKDLASEMKLKASQLVSCLFMKGLVLTLNDFLDDETTIQLLGHDFGCEITIDTSEEERLQITGKTIREEVLETPQEQLQLRPPVVTFMGHVDHGKTSLIDAIRASNMVADEAGAITQHIGAFRCHTAVGDLTILDTPGHEAFSAMRARGADVTDLVVLVIAGDEGMKAQTLEALKQAKEAQVPIMVAINKSDKPGFNAENVYRELSEHELLPEAWGGQTVTVNCSALTKAGIPDLLEMLALQAQVLELKANPQGRARGTVIESEMHKGFGAVATVLVQNGTLHLGDSLVFDECWGRVKTMHDEFGFEVESAGPSAPVKITGLSDLPAAGSEFIAVSSEKEAKALSSDRTQQTKTLALQKKKSGLENLLQQEAEKQEKKNLTLFLRADVQGSLEALKHSLEKIASNKIDLNIVSAEVGEVSESDITLAAASKATIIGFHTQIESRAEPLIKQLKVTVRLHDIIYHAVDDVKALMLAQLDKIAQENDAGRAEVKAVFKSSHLGNIAGCQVMDGTIKRSCHVRVIRGKEVVWKGAIHSLKRVKEDVREVSKGQECGILLQGFSDFVIGDELQAYDITYLAQEL